MNRILLFIAFFMLCGNLKGQTLDASYFLDFGLEDNNGHITTSPDANNNHWNNIINPDVVAPALNLITNTGNSSSINLTITSAFLKNGIAQGGLVSPSSALLGDFAIGTATEDFFFTNTNGKGAFRLTGLNPKKIYVFKIFGTREATDARISQYKITGTNTSVKTLQTSGTAIGSGVYNGNNNHIVFSDYVIPTSNGFIDLELTKTSGGYGYINIIKIEEYTPAPEYQYEKINNSYFLDFGPNDITNGDITPSPDANANYWNNIMNPAISAPAVNLINNKGNTSNLNLTITSPFKTNGKVTGGLLSPADDLLGEFGIATATEDYFFLDGSSNMGSLRLSGLDPAKSYVFKFFATRDAADVRTSQYKIIGINTSIKTLQTSGSGVGIGSNGNNNNIVISDYVKPTAAGVIDIELTKTVSIYAYVGIIKIEEYVPVALPVQLKSFNGIINKEGVKLFWTTASEQNTHHFELESKSNAEGFQKIDEISAAGNSNSFLDYSIIDKNQYDADNVYYRLKIIDNDGAVSYSNVINVKQVALSNQLFSVYPNPFSTQIKINYPEGFKGVIHIRIINSNGKVVKEILSIHSITDIDTSDLIQGHYILTVSGSNGDIIGSQKILKF